MATRTTMTGIIRTPCVASISTSSHPVFCFEIMNTIFTFEKLYKAYKQCLKHKKNTTNALKFEMNREKNLSKLLYDLQTGSYKISRHICFVITHPSPREIFAADFRDRIVHHLLCNEIQELFEQDFSINSYANRKYFGIHKAVKKLKWHLVRGGKNRQKLYFLKMDIKNFFRSIDKDILWNIVLEKIKFQNKPNWWKEEVLWLAKMIVFHVPADNYIFRGKMSTLNIIPRYKSLLCGDQNKGLPIGNLTSQFFANVYLNELDKFIEQKLFLKRHLRYVDDFLILDEDKEKLKENRKQISNFCEQKLLLKICSDKTILREIGNGIDFLGYFVKPTHTLVRRSVLSRFKVKFFKVLDSNGFVSIADIPMVKSYIGHFGHANSWELRKRFGLIE